MDVQWASPPGYEGLYEISTIGQVRSCDRIVTEGSGRSRHLKAREKIHTVDSRGYHTVSLYKDGVESIKLVHRLVAETFIPNPDNLSQVDHIDGNKDKNWVSNLEWVSLSQNITHAHSEGLISTPSAQIQRMSAASAKARAVAVRCVDDGLAFSSMQEAAEHYNIKISAVYDSVHDGRPHRGYTFERLHKPKSIFGSIPTDAERSKKHYACPVRCVETGQLFESRGKAASALNIPESSVYDSLRDGNPHRGYTFQNVLYDDFVKGCTED